MCIGGGGIQFCRCICRKVQPLDVEGLPLSGSIFAMHAKDLGFIPWCFLIGVGKTPVWDPGAPLLVHVGTIELDRSGVSGEGSFLCKDTPTRYALKCVCLGWKCPQCGNVLGRVEVGLSMKSSWQIHPISCQELLTGRKTRDQYVLGI